MISVLQRKSREKGSVISIKSAPNWFLLPLNDVFVGHWVLKMIDISFANTNIEII